MSPPKVTRIVIVGGGHSAHTLAGLLSSVQGNDVRWFAPFQDEAHRIKQGIEKHGGITLTNPDKSTTVGKPTLVTNDPEEAMKAAQLVLIPLPAFAIPSMLKSIEPFVPKGCYVGALPAQTGFQWTARSILKGQKAVIFGLAKLPYNCRIQEFGSSVRVYIYKRGIQLAADPPERAAEVAQVLNDTIPHIGVVALESFIPVTLATSNQCIHPARMYGLSQAAPDGYDDKVLFYETMDDFSSDLIQAVSDELQAIGKAAAKALHKKIDVPGVQQGLRDSDYKFKDDSSLKQMLRTADGFQAIYAPMTRKDGKWFPDFSSRYLTEDIPALCVSRGLAMLLNVSTPAIDKLILWGQEAIGKSYLVPSKSDPEALSLEGEHIHQSGAPQAFGINSVDDPRII